MTDEQIRALARTTVEKLQWPRLDPAQETDEQIIAAALRRVREADAQMVEALPVNTISDVAFKRKVVALAAPPSQENAQNAMPDTRLAELPSAAHRDLPRQVTGPSVATAPENGLAHPYYPTRVDRIRAFFRKG